MATPLQGCRIAITRASAQVASFAEQLTALGAETIICPAIAIVAPENLAPLDQALRQITRYEWILFTSANGVTATLDRFDQLGLDRAKFMRVQIGAVGSATTAALAEYGLTPSLVPKTSTGKALAASLAERLAEQLDDLHGRHILLPRASIARSDLPSALRTYGAQVDDIIAYRTVPGDGIQPLVEHVRNGTVDVITFASPSAVRNFMDGLHTSHTRAAAASSSSTTDHHVAGDPLGDDATRPAIICIGPVTAAAAHELHIPVDRIASAHDAIGLANAIVQWFTARPTQVRS